MTCLSAFYFIIDHLTMRKSEAQGVETGTYAENRNKIWRRTEAVHFICYDKHAEGPSTKHRPGRNVLCLGRCFMQHHKRSSWFEGFTDELFWIRQKNRKSDQIDTGCLPCVI